MEMSRLANALLRALVRDLALGGLELRLKIYVGWCARMLHVELWRRARKAPLTAGRGVCIWIMCQSRDRK